MSPMKTIKAANMQRGLKKIISTFFLLASLCNPCLASKPCSGFDPNNNDLQTLQKSGELRIAVHDSEAPWSWRNAAGEWEGFDIELCQFLAKELDVKAVFLPLRYHNESELIARLRNNQVDLAVPETNLSLNALKFMFASNPYSNKSLAVLFNHLVMPGNSANRVLRQLDNNHSIIGTLDNYQETSYLKQKTPQIEVVHYRTLPELIRSLEKNRVHALIGNYTELNNWLTKHPAKRLRYRLFKIPKTQQNIAFAVGPKHWRLLQWLNVNIRYQKNLSGKLLDKLKEKYLAQ